MPKVAEHAGKAAAISGVGKALEAYTGQRAEQVGALTRSLAAVRAIQESVGVSALAKVAEQAGKAVETSRVGKALEKQAQSISANQRQIERLNVESPEPPARKAAREAWGIDTGSQDSANARVDEVDELAWSTSETGSALTHLPHEQDQRLGEAAQLLADLHADYKALKTEYRHNPCKQVYMAMTLTDGTELAVKNARNIGYFMIEVTGRAIGTGEERKIRVGLGVVTIEVKVVDLGPRRPMLRLIENNSTDGD